MEPTTIQTDVLPQILYYVSPNEIAINCRQVCKEWKSATHRLSLWQKIGASIDIELHPNPIEMETAVKNYLSNRKIVISSDARLLRKLHSFFSNPPKGETRALHYYSTSHQDASGFYIRGHNSHLLNNFNGPQGSTIQPLIEFFKTLPLHQRLTIEGKNESDYFDVDGMDCGYSIVGEKVETQQLFYNNSIDQFLKTYPPS